MRASSRRRFASAGSCSRDAVRPLLPARAGHFLLESGYHTDTWLTLDAMFVDPTAIAPLVDALAAKLRAHAPTAVCGSLLGGAFLAHALAVALGVRFYFSEPSPSSASAGAGLFAAEYRLPPGLALRISGERVAVVDDVISAGSSARATVRAAIAAGAQPVAVGTLMALGSAGASYFAGERIPFEAVERRAFNMWTPDQCPLCRAALVLERPTG
jgi:orotate phosphoribosyltransferase